MESQKIMVLNNDHVAIPIIVESCAFEGVKKIADKVGQDIEKICGIKPKIIEDFTQANDSFDKVILFATLDKSPIIDSLEKEGKFDLSEIRNKREVYKTQILDNPFKGINQALIICGSDKRGTIYGMFSLSEFIGVSPLHFWGDVTPAKNNQIQVSQDIETVSKEPSVKYRGFFINDEWPCFGNWTFSHFNGFTAEMYDHVFELLLRLKGNYLWPAMWTSSFPLDGPGNLNEELADIYGVIVGNSHHEPCLRASEEWDKVRGQDSCYGNEWNYYTNREGLLKYWEDGLKRSGKYEHIVTIGIRGERDSSMLGSDATLKQNIDLLKDVIINQRKLIKKYVNEDLSKVPQLLALYKEVEEYFYGNEETTGLKDWDEIEDVICMLCEDNFGFMRTLPTKELLNRKGGFGMYYHFDYHGAPISYEWMPSTPFSKVWEQMCMAYDFGVKDLWIVNVGDLKFNEVPLTYFMALAYDFEKWGSNSLDSSNLYIKQWVNNTFPFSEEETQDKMAKILDEYIRINGMRRPEALNSKIYHPCHYLESDNVLDWVNKIDEMNEEVYATFNKNKDENEKEAYYSTIYFPAKSSMNLVKMHLYAGKNAHYTAQGKAIANKYADMVKECIEKDKQLSKEFASFRNGKWKGMELEQHIGFTRWNDDDYRYPVMMYVEPAHKPRLIVSRKDSIKTATKTYGKPMKILVDDFMYEGNTEVILEIANGGIEGLKYTVKFDDDASGENCDWLTVSSYEGTVALQDEIILRCDREKLQNEVQKVKLLISDGDSTVAVKVKGKAVNKENLPTKTFLENNGIITIEANHYCSKHDTPHGKFCELKNYGRSGCGMKVFPNAVSFTEKDDKPSLTYRFMVENSNNYNIDIWTTPTNPVQNKQALRFLLTDSCGGSQIIEAVPNDFKSGNWSDARWCDGVLRQIRVSKASLLLNEGIQEITIGALEAGFILERILIYSKDQYIKDSYLGPKESFYII